jgi:uncharacterized protein
VTVGLGPRPRRRAATAFAAATYAALLVSPGPPGAALDVPPLASRVTDLASILSPAARERLDATLRGLEDRTGAQVAVLTIPSLDGESLEAYSVRVAQAWKLGRKGVDDGVLFLIAKSDRKMRFEVGYGLEPKLTDALTREILDDRVRPRFRAGDFDGGIEAGVAAVAAAIEGAPLPAKPPPPRGRGVRSGAGWGTILFMGGIFTLVVGVHSLVAVLNPTAMGWFLYVFLMPFYLAFPSFMFPPYGGVVACAAWIVAFPFLRYWFKPWSKEFKIAHPALAGFSGGGRSGSGGSWSSGSGGSSGSFSGGGGSFGGGGSSSSW